MTTLYENMDDVYLCENCDSEFTVNKIDDEEADVCFCPYCGDPVVEIDEDDLEGLDNEFND